MDELNTHRAHELVELCREAGVELAFLPPYSPDFNPIEQSFHALKEWMRTH
jgi:transposase